MLPAPKPTGRPRKYCGGACRQADWVARQSQRDVQLTEHELVLARAQVDELHDHLYVLECAIEDAERDLATMGPRLSAKELEEVIHWLIENARPLLAQRLKPV
jgi:hypothetical protein